MNQQTPGILSPGDDAFFDTIEGVESLDKIADDYLSVSASLLMEHIMSSLLVTSQPSESQSMKMASRIFHAIYPRIVQSAALKVGDEDYMEHLIVSTFREDEADLH